MKHIKYGLLGLGVLSTIAVFLPYMKIESASISLWQAGKLAGSMTPVYAILLMALALAGIAGFAVKKGRLSRLGAAVTMVLCLGILVSVVKVGGGGDDGILKYASIGLYILLFGPLVGVVASLVGLIKAERALQNQLA